MGSQLTPLKTLCAILAQSHACSPVHGAVSIGFKHIVQGRMPCCSIPLPVQSSPGGEGSNRTMFSALFQMGDTPI